MFKCEICGKEWPKNRSFLRHLRIHKMSGKEYYDKFLKKDGEGKCKKCRKETKFVGVFCSGYNLFCSLKCSNSDSDVKAKKEESYIKRYKVNNPSKVLEVKEKIKASIKSRTKEQKELSKKKSQETCLARYGTISPNCVNGVKLKKQMTCLKNYNVINPMQSNKIREKAKNTLIARYNVESSLQLIQSPSGPQIKMFNIVKEEYTNAEIEYWINSKCKLDIVIPNLKIDIEYDSSYWHPDAEKDEKRDEMLKSKGWKIIRYRDYIPTKLELLEDIKLLRKE